ncbi:hypothetical protein C1637_09745 [Chryseobacterium lactis]|uniref:DUF3276 family protein n=1 Tax=Chryseobacterium lactis TaxID=1241981 RepID=A0A3G6RER6_CHRLC|nr:hypothetical protein [Chryseobacterium lactis]AZA82207.1 hypothetical protein EG342_09955 [Chryseobacterium lactis]AZB02588.1 hypothetical protein EG341_00810 [Chryseobacterium lactis]PNW14117.1 hypothetical protein C1637_09745 [Chryseobacterium lactis]
MENKNSDFVQFTKKELKNGTETISKTEYKGYVIRLRTYNGASMSISKENGKGFTELYKRNYSFGLLSNLLQKAKDYIDNHEDNLIRKFESKNDNLLQKDNNIS